MREALEFLWKCARSKTPMVQQPWLDEQSTALRNILLEKGYLVRSCTQSNCVRVHGELREVIRTLYSSGETRFFFHEDGIPCEIDKAVLQLYLVVFPPLTDLLRDGLECGGEKKEILPGLLWKIGTAGQQRREVYLARNWGNEPAVHQFLENVKAGSLVFRFGCSPATCRFPDAQVYEIADLVDWDGDKFVLDAKAVFDNLKDMVASRPQRSRKKSQPKQVEYQQQAENLLNAWFLYKYENDKRKKHGLSPLKPTIDLNFTDQQSFAKQLKIQEVAVTRMKKTWTDDMLENGYVYKQLLDILGKDGSDYFIDFYNNHKEYMRKIGIEY